MLPLKSDFMLPDNQNESLSHLGLELLRRVNEKVPMFIDNKLNPVRANIVNYFNNIFNDEKYVVPKNTFFEYENEFKESNEWVRKRYFPSKKKLFHTKEYESETTIQLADNELNQIADLLADIWINKQDRIISLTKRPLQNNEDGKL